VIDTFLKDQLDLLRKLNERVAKIQAEVNQNGELLIHNRAVAEQMRRDERPYRVRNPKNDRRKSR
jgi:hypothetical protein